MVAAVARASPGVPEARSPAAAAKPKGPKPDLVAYVHLPDCIACRACADACPSTAITVVDLDQIDPGLCEACSECVPVCPTSCILLQPRAAYAPLESAVMAA